MLLINNEQVQEVLNMESSIEAIEEGLNEFYRGDATCRPRTDLWSPCGQPNSYFQWGSMEGTSRRYMVFAIRMKSDIAYWEKTDENIWTHEYYCQTPGKFCGLIMLFSLQNGEPLAIFNDGYLQHMRSGATIGLGAKHLALPQAETLGMLGSGWMARTHATAICSVRPVRTIKVYSPSREHRSAYAEEMRQKLKVEVLPVENPEEAVRDSEIVSCCTDSIVPVLKGEWLREGAFVSSVKDTIELDEVTLSRISRFLSFTPRPISLDTKPVSDIYAAAQSHSGKYQAYIAGRPEELATIPPAKRPETKIAPDKIFTLKDLLEGKAEARKDAREILSIASGGIQGIQFASVCGLVYQRIKQTGLGQNIPTDWFLQTIRN
jgi:alanine dehydrogenase